MYSPEIEVKLDTLTDDMLSIWTKDTSANKDELFLAIDKFNIKELGIQGCNFHKMLLLKAFKRNHTDLLDKYHAMVNFHPLYLLSIACGNIGDRNLFEKVVDYYRENLNDRELKIVGLDPIPDFKSMPIEQRWFCGIIFSRNIDVINQLPLDVKDYENIYLFRFVLCEMISCKSELFDKVDYKNLQIFANDRLRDPRLHIYYVAAICRNRHVVNRLTLLGLSPSINSLVYLFSQIALGDYDNVVRFISHNSSLSHLTPLSLYPLCEISDTDSLFMPFTSAEIVDINYMDSIAVNAVNKNSVNKNPVNKNSVIKNSVILSDLDVTNKIIREIFDLAMIYYDEKIFTYLCRAFDKPGLQILHNKFVKVLRQNSDDVSDIWIILKHGTESDMKYKFIDTFKKWIDSGFAKFFIESVRDSYELVLLVKYGIIDLNVFIHSVCKKMKGDDSNIDKSVNKLEYNKDTNKLEYNRGANKDINKSENDRDGKDGKDGKDINKSENDRDDEDSKDINKSENDRDDKDGKDIIKSDIKTDKENTNKIMNEILLTLYIHYLMHNQFNSLKIATKYKIKKLKNRANKMKQYILSCISYVDVIANLIMLYC